MFGCVLCAWSIERLILIDHQRSLHLLDFCTQKRAPTMNTLINCDLSKIQPQIIIYDFIDGNLNPFVFAVRRARVCSRLGHSLCTNHKVEIQQKFNVLNILLDFFSVAGDQWRIREFCDWIRSRFDLIKIDWDSNCVCIRDAYNLSMSTRSFDGLMYRVLESLVMNKNKANSSLASTFSLDKSSWV